MTCPCRDVVAAHGWYRCRDCGTPIERYGSVAEALVVMRATIAEARLRKLVTPTKPPPSGSTGATAARPPRIPTGRTESAPSAGTSSPMRPS
jgi:hypothetical protein